MEAVVIEKKKINVKSFRERVQEKELGKIERAWRK